jgi:hypothetical protein
MSKVGHSAKRVGKFASGICRSRHKRTTKIRCIKLPTSIAKTLSKKKSISTKKRIFRIGDKSNQEIKGAERYCLNQSFLYQSLEESHMSKEKIPDRIVMWKVHAPDKISKRLELASKALKSNTPISTRNIKDLADNSAEQQESQKLNEEWSILKKPDADRHSRIGAIQPYK